MVAAGEMLHGSMPSIKADDNHLKILSDTMSDNLMHQWQSQASFNQATFLPNEVTAVFLNITKLSPRSSTTVWCNEVMSVLRPFGLEGLIDLELPRPHESDPQFRKWRFWTPVVAHWLLNQLEDSLQAQVQAHSNRLSLADDVFRAIITVNSASHRLYIERELEKWNRLKRSDFATATDFIIAFQAQYNRLKAEDEEEPAGMALARLLDEIDGEFLRVTFIRSEVIGLDREVDYRLFSYYCRLLIEETRTFRDTDTGGGFQTGRQGGGGGAGRGGGSSMFGGGEVSYRSWRRMDSQQPH
ncbi:unnamed protein product [Penicillium bialowiezense]